MGVGQVFQDPPFRYVDHVSGCQIPRFTQDGKAVLYTSDLTGYSNLYMVEIGDFDELPDLE